MQHASDPTRTEEPAAEELLPLPSPGCIVERRYRIVRSIAAGGMGSVFEAELLPLGRRCAVKFLRRELAGRSRSLARFEREARLLGRLQHEHLTAVLDYGTYLGQTPFLVMEYLDGCTLKQLLQRESPLALERSIEILLQLARGMAYVHTQSIVHRDLKPENLMLLERSDGRPWVKILDFGIARALEDTGRPITRSGTELGTAHYMSPEQARGAKTITAGSDVYALGVIAYEVLAGTRVHPGDSYNAVIFQLLTQPHRPLREALPDCPAALAAIVERCLEKDPERRYPDAGALASELAALGLPEPAAFSGRLAAQQRQRKLIWPWVAAGAVFAALCADTSARIILARRAALESAGATATGAVTCLAAADQEASAAAVASLLPAPPEVASVTLAAAPVSAAETRPAATPRPAAAPPAKGTSASRPARAPIHEPLSGDAAGPTTVTPAGEALPFVTSNPYDDH
jgi:predicted Ser/Thr protein kinase